MIDVTDEEFVSLRLPDAPVALTDWAKEPSLQDLKKEFDACESPHASFVADLDRWEALMECSGKAAAPKVKGRSAVQPKLIRRQAEWRYSALSEPFLGSDKMFSVEPATFEDVDAAKQNELLLNYQFRTKLNKVKFIDEYVRSTVDEGTCILRTYWVRDVETVTKTVPVWHYYGLSDPDEQEAFMQSVQEYQGNPRIYLDKAPPDAIAAIEYFLQTGAPVIAVQVGVEETEEEVVLDSRPAVEILNPRNVRIDPSCNGDMSKARFAIISFETSKADLYADSRYKNLDQIDWTNQSTDSDPTHTTSTPQNYLPADSNKRKVIAHEYWGYFDIHNEGKPVPILATWVGNTLIRMEENPFPDKKIPLVVVNYLPKKRSVYGETDAELLEDNQKILGAVTRGMIDLMGRSANSQRGMSKGMLDALNKRRFENGEDYEFNPNNHPSNGIIEHRFPEIPASAYQMLQLQNQEAEALTGVKSFAGGMSGNAYGDVAAGIRGMLDAASKREMAILRRLAQGLIEVGNKIIAMNAVFLSDKEVIRITNKMYVEIKREDLQGNFDLIADISTAEIDNNKAQDLGFMLQTIGPTVDFSVTKLILAEIATLKRMPDLADRIAKYNPEPSQEEQMLKQLEIQKAQLENAKLEAEIDEIRARASKTLHEATKTDIANARTLTGQEHKESMEKDSAQSEGNRDLEVTKALLKSKKDGEQSGDIDAAIGYNELTRTKPSSIMQRMNQEPDNSELNLGSSQFDPSLDPALNQSINL